MAFSSIVNLRTSSYSFLFTNWISNSLWFILDTDNLFIVVQEVFHFAGVFRELCFRLTELFLSSFLHIFLRDFSSACFNYLLFKKNT